MGPGWSDQRVIARERGNRLPDSTLKPRVGTYIDNKTLRGGIRRSDPGGHRSARRERATRYAYDGALKSHIDPGPHGEAFDDWTGGLRQVRIAQKESGH